MDNQLPNYIVNNLTFKAIKHHLDYLVSNYQYDVCAMSCNEIRRLLYYQLLEDIFDISLDKIKEFIATKMPQLKITDFYYELRPFDTEFCKEISFFIFTLPTLEYDLYRSFKYRLANCLTENILSNNLQGLGLEIESTSQFSDSEVLTHFEAVVNSSSKLGLLNKFPGMAFRNITNTWESLQEPNHKQTFKSCVIDPMISFTKRESRQTIHSISAICKYNNCLQTDVVELLVYLAIENNDNQQELEDCCTIEEKPFPITPKNDNDPIKGSSFYTINSIPSFMRQKIAQMTFYKTNYGVLTNENSTVFLQIDLDIFDIKKKEEFSRSQGDRAIPLNYKIVNNLSQTTSAGLSMLYDFYKSAISLDDLKDRQKKMLKFGKYLKKDQYNCSWDQSQNSKGEGGITLYLSDSDSSDSDTPDNDLTRPPISRGGYRSLPLISEEYEVR